MAPVKSEITFIAFSVLLLVLINSGDGLTFTQQDYEARSHSALLQGIREFKIEKSELFSELQSTEDFPFSDEDTDLTDLKKCSCREYGCGCCMHVKIEKIGLDADVCLKVSYLPSEIGIQAQLTVDGKVIFTKKVSAKNPPAICAGVPGLKKLASLCIRFYDLSVAGKKFSGCVELQAKLAKVLVEKVKIGCFKLPPKVEDVNSENLLLVDSSNGYQIENVALPNEVQQVNHLVSETNQESSGKTCTCQKDSCQCCSHLKTAPQYKVCLNTTLLPKETGFQAELSVNGNIILNNKVTAQSPSPMCISFTTQVGVCLVFKNLHVAEKKAGGCSEVDVRMSGRMIGKIDLGCFNIPSTDIGISSENSLIEINDDLQIEQVPLPMNLKQSYKLSFEYIQESMGKSCSCQKDSCQCCAHLKVRKAHLDAQICLKASFLPKEIGFEAEVTINGKTIFKQKITAQNPPPICFTVEEPVVLCLHFKNLQISKNSLQGCVDVEVKLAVMTVAKVHIGCFKLPPKEIDMRVEFLKQLAPTLVQSLMKENIVAEEAVTSLSVDKPKCQGDADSFSCCMKFPVGPKPSICTKIVFLPSSLSVDLQLLYDGKVIFHHEVKVKDPPPVCVPVTFISKSASVCLKLSNLIIEKDGVSGCLEVEAKMKKITVAKFKLGCFKIPPKVDSQDLIGISVEE